MIQKQAIFIFGMGRSGTSALTRVLSLCGASLPGQLLGPNDGNPKGHWEPVEALNLNEEFLFFNGSTYYDPSLRLQETLPVDDSQKAQFIEKIAAFLNSCPSDRPVVLKEPRIVGLSDFWFEAARRCGFDVKVIISVRHPGEVAASLARRDQASFELSNALWLKYNLLAERRSREWPRVFVEYSNLLTDWHKEVARISRGLSVRFDDRDEDAIREFLTKDLHRQRCDGAPVEAFGDPWVGMVYAAVAMAARDDDVDTRKLDDIFAAYSTSERTFRVASNEFRNRFSGFHWASDLTGFLARVVEECGAEIARRFGDSVEPAGAPVDDTRRSFYRQVDRVSATLNALAEQDSQHEQAQRRVAELEQLNSALVVEIQHTRSNAEMLAKQLPDAYAKLTAAYADLESHRRSAQDREDTIRHQCDAAQEQIEQLHSLISSLKTQVETYKRSRSWRLTAPLRAARRLGRAAALAATRASGPRDVTAVHEVRPQPHSQPEVATKRPRQ